MVRLGILSAKDAELICAMPIVFSVFVLFNKISWFMGVQQNKEMCGGKENLQPKSAQVYNLLLELDQQFYEGRIFGLSCDLKS